MIAVQTLADFTTALAARQPTPGGGAAAAVTVALACASAAMACRYTTGDKFAVVSGEATSLANRLDGWRQQALTLADADAEAYAAVRAAKAAKNAKAISDAVAAAARIPADLIALCTIAAAACAGFRPRCNPFLVSDIDTALHLLAGAGRAAQRTLLINQPPAGTRTAAADAVAELARWESAC
jgi:formiminotetrahydrofolate cyclodeaminase